MRPKAVGPRMIPPSTSEMTFGWRMRFRRRLRSCAVIMIIPGNETVSDFFQRVVAERREEQRNGDLNPQVCTLRGQGDVRSRSMEEISRSAMHRTSAKVARHSPTWMIHRRNGSAVLNSVGSFPLSRPPYRQEERAMPASQRSPRSVPQARRSRRDRRTCSCAARFPKAELVRLITPLENSLIVDVSGG